MGAFQQQPLLCILPRPPQQELSDHLGKFAAAGQAWEIVGFTHYNPISTAQDGQAVLQLKRPKDPGLLQTKLWLGAAASWRAEGCPDAGKEDRTQKWVWWLDRSGQIPWPTYPSDTFKRPSEELPPAEKMILKMIHYGLQKKQLSPKAKRMSLSQCVHVPCEPQSGTWA